MMILLICVMPIRVVHGESGTFDTELKLDSNCNYVTVNGNRTDEYYFKTSVNGTIHLGVGDNNVEFALYSDKLCTNKITTGTDIYVNLKAGIYYVVVSASEDYWISANFSPATGFDLEPNNSMEEAVLLTSGVQIKGNADSDYSDVDWYKVVIKTKSYINFTLNTGGRLVNIYKANNMMTLPLSSSGPMIFDNPGVYYMEVRSNNFYGYYELKADIVEFPTPNEITGAVYRGSRRVDLTWSKSNYADGYQLFYKTSENGKWNPITTIYSGNTTSYTHYYGPSEGQIYYYGVMAFRKDKVYDELYNQEDAAGYKVTATSNANVNNNTVKSLSKVTGVKAKKKKSYNIIQWKKNPNATGYKVYRKVGSGSFKLIKTTSATSFKDKKVKKGKKDTYKIKAYHKNYTYNASKKKYTTTIVTSKFSKAVSVKR